MRAEPPDPRPSRAASQVQIRLVGQSREALEAALARLQTTAGLQVQRGPRRGRKGAWLVYATLSVATKGQPSRKGETTWPDQEASDDGS